MKRLMRLTLKQHLMIIQVRFISIMFNKVDVCLDYDSVDTVTKHSVLGADESDSNLVAVSKCEANLTG